MCRLSDAKSENVLYVGLKKNTPEYLLSLLTQSVPATGALFECNVMLTLAQEKNEFNLQSAALVLLMLFTYSKLWVVVVLRAMWMTVKKIVSKTDYTWYKTERSAD